MIFSKYILHNNTKRMKNKKGTMKLLRNPKHYVEVFKISACLKYGPLVSGLTYHFKFADDFLKTSAVSHLSWPHL